MPRRKSLGFLITALGLVATAVTGARTSGRSGDEEAALNLLVKAFDRVSPRNVIAVMRMSLDSSEQRETVQVEISQDGRQRIEVIEPLQRSGVIILELGELRETYDPDKHTLVIGRSMAADLFKPNERLRLVRRNYRVRITRDVIIAGRKIVRIDATSHYPEVGGASIYIDPVSYFVMRVDAVSAAGKRVKRFDTTTVSYPATLSEDTFVLKEVNMSTERESDPIPVSNIAEAARKVGFHPLKSSGLPFGFVIRKTYVRLDPAKTIGFNLSDGLTAATIFEFDLKHCPASVRTGIQEDMRKRPLDYFRSGDTVVGIVSNLAPKARKKLLDSFRPVRHTSMNDPENFFNGDGAIDLSLGLGTNPGCERVTRYRRMWRTQPQLG